MFYLGLIYHPTDGSNSKQQGADENSSKRVWRWITFSDWIWSYDQEATLCATRLTTKRARRWQANTSPLTSYCFGNEKKRTHKSATTPTRDGQFLTLREQKSLRFTSFVLYNHYNSRTQRTSAISLIITDRRLKQWKESGNWELSIITCLSNNNIE